MSTEINRNIAVAIVKKDAKIPMSHCPSWLRSPARTGQLRSVPQNPTKNYPFWNMRLCEYHPFSDTPNCHSVGLNFVEICTYIYIYICVCTCIYNFPIISTLFISPYIIIYPRCIRRGLHWVLTHTLMKHLEWNKVETSAQTSVFCAKRLSQTEYLGNIWEVSVEPIGKSPKKTMAAWRGIPVHGVS